MNEWMDEMQIEVDGTKKTFRGLDLRCCGGKGGGVQTTHNGGGGEEEVLPWANIESSPVWDIFSA